MILKLFQSQAKREEKIEEIEEILEEKCKEEVETKTDASLIQAEVKVVPEETDIQENKDASSSSSSSSSDNEEEEIKTVEEEKVDVVTITKDDIFEDLKEAKESEITKSESETEAQPEKPIASSSSSDDEQEKESAEIQDIHDDKKDAEDD